MKARNIILLLTVIVVVIIAMYSFYGGQSDTSLVDEINKERENRDRFMRSSNESPFASQKEDFKGLHYFPANSKYRIIADLKPVDNKKPVVLTTSDGKEQTYLEYAWAEFDLDQFHNRLIIYEVIGIGPARGKLFLAFTDATSGTETYGAGRYLDINKVPGSQTIVLDFNKAYNPYCAYIDSYSCPLPPQENHLNVAIRAGEKAYHE